MKKKFKVLLALAPLPVFACVGIGYGIAYAVNNAGQPQTVGPSIPEGDYEFLFTGNVEASTGREFSLYLAGNKDDDQTLTLGVLEMPALNVSGTWTFTENKGYKIFLNDSAGTFAYSRYDVETSTFSVQFDFNMGNYGTPRAVLTYVDEEFASVYVGIGLGLKPPTFSLEGYSTYNHYSYGTLTFQENGTISTQLTNSGAGWYYARTGFWEYDEETNVYDYWFTDNTINLDDGNLAIRGEEENQYINRTTYTKDNESPVFNTRISLDDFINVYHMFTGEEYKYHTEFDEESGRYYAEVDAQYNWGLNTGDICTFSGYASLADMEG